MRCSRAATTDKSAYSSNYRSFIVIIGSLAMNNFWVPVSVIIPCYECQTTLRRALVSIEQQSVHPAEIIVVDDGNSLEVRQQILTICRKSSLDDKIICIHLSPRSGPATARNAAWHRASQEFIAFLDADDAWHPKKLEVQYRFMTGNDTIAISSHQIKMNALFDRFDPTLNGIAPRYIKFHRQLIKNEFMTTTVMLKRRIPLRFDSEKMHSEDYLLWLEILRNGYRGAHLPLPLASAYKQFFGEGGLSRNLWRMEKGEIDTYMKLYKKRYISFPIFNALLILSIAKYLRRFALSKLAPLNRP